MTIQSDRIAYIKDLEQENKKLNETLSHLINEPNWIENTTEFSKMFDENQEMKQKLKDLTEFPSQSAFRPFIEENQVLVKENKKLRAGIEKVNTIVDRMECFDYKGTDKEWGFTQVKDELKAILESMEMK